MEKKRTKKEKKKEKEKKYVGKTQSWIQESDSTFISRNEREIMWLDFLLSFIIYF